MSTRVPGGTGTAIGTGAANTDKIIAQNGVGSSYAAGLARAYRGGGYSDWYLPSSDELDKLYRNRAAISAFVTVWRDHPYYWSSSEFFPGKDARLQYFVNGNQLAHYKYDVNRVRAVRAF
jgi:hypothetical protein